MNQQLRMITDTGCFVDLVDAPVDVAELQQLLSDPDTGAHAWFLGVTRRRTETGEGVRETEHLSYESHRPMAIRELSKIALSARQQYELHRIVIVHRLGLVPIGETSVAVGCSSPHRLATFQALPWVMDELKREAPIWKRETFVDGSRAWVHPQ